MQAVTLIGHESRSVGYYLRPHLIPLMIWRHRDLIGQLIRRTVASRYRGSVLGVLWSIVLPLTMLVIYTFVFSGVLGAKWGVRPSESKTEFALTLFCGLLLYNAFAECISACTGAVVSQVSYVKKVVFPLEVLPVVHLGAALFNALMSFLILVAGIAVLQQRIPFTLVYYPLTVIPLAFLCLGLGWFVASVSVYLRDVGQVVAVILQMLIFLTPIFYPISQLKSPAIQFVMRLNPLSVIVENARRTVMYNQPPEWPWLGVVTLVGLVTMQLGYVWFMKTRRGFADVV